ncbi:hypothetical protein SteCoe_3989 [Stentor coeruleus]|uniref:Uncharacterized protein n=1 Tax=Stentor coeruleus TaxID=5963 RepID=A0A1R2CVY0_9CILI|nr:hypothetical protein SteCoe_3989 [Stentor coeruleus]
MAQLMQIIDKRTAKFTNKGPQPIPQALTKESRKVKLTPLSTLPNANSKNDISAASPPQKVRRIKLKASQTIAQTSKISDSTENKETITLNSIKKLQTSIPNSILENLENFTLDQLEIKSVDDESCENPNIEDHKEEQNLENNTENIGSDDDDYKTNEINEEQDERICDEVFLSFWLSFAAQIEEIMKPPVIENFKWIFEYKEKAKKAVEAIGLYWKYTRKDRKRFLSAQKIARILQVKVREMIKRKYLRAELEKKKRIFEGQSAAAIKIQKVYKGYKVYKKYQPIIEERVKVRKHKEFLEKQNTLRKARNHKKQVVRFIEEQWSMYQNKKKMREVRKYLMTLPYECRLLYFKFQQVKQDADSLKNDVDLLISKKQGKVD